jgi:uncharacterized protein (TIGR02145 family)
MKKATIALLLICTAAFAQQKGSFTDTRDKKTYKTVKIGEQTWMAENLNYDAKGSKCYDNKPENCAKYGRFYNHNTAMKACPKGWHLPSDDEWQKLVDIAGGDETAGAILKAASGWNNNGNGTDEFGFSALPGGNGDNRGGFSSVGDYGCWWSASKFDNNDTPVAGFRLMDYSGSYVTWDFGYLSGLQSVRCLQG